MLLSKLLNMMSKAKFIQTVSTLLGTTPSKHEVFGKFQTKSIDLLIVIRGGVI